MNKPQRYNLTLTDEELQLLDQLARRQSDNSSSELLCKLRSFYEPPTRSVFLNHDILNEICVFLCLGGIESLRDLLSFSLVCQATRAAVLEAAGLRVTSDFLEAVEKSRSVNFAEEQGWPIRNLCYNVSQYNKRAHLYLHPTLVWYLKQTNFEQRAVAKVAGEILLKSEADRAKVLLSIDERLDENPTELNRDDLSMVCTSSWTEQVKVHSGCVYELGDSFHQIKTKSLTFDPLYFNQAGGGTITVGVIEDLCGESNEAKYCLVALQACLDEDDTDESEFGGGLFGDDSDDLF